MLQENRRPKTGKSSDDLREKLSDKKNGLFSWYRYPSIGKGQKKRDAPDLPYSEPQNNISSAIISFPENIMSYISVDLTLSAVDVVMSIDYA